MASTKMVGADINRGYKMSDFEPTTLELEDVVYKLNEKYITEDLEMVTETFVGFTLEISYHQKVISFCGIYLWDGEDDPRNLIEDQENYVETVYDFCSRRYKEIITQMYLPILKSYETNLPDGP